MRLTRRVLAVLTGAAVVATSALTGSASAAAASGLAPAASTAGETAVRLNVGGGTYRDTAGRTWSADSGAVGGRLTRVAAQSVAGTSDDTLYQTLRVAMSAYRVAVPAAGTYRVTLHVQENYHDAVGERMFSVTAEGASVLRDLDLIAAVGRYTAHTVTKDVTVTDGTLDLGFSARTDLATLSAVEAVLISPVGPTPAPTTAPVAPATPPEFPIRAGGDRTSLVDANGAPFLYLADTAWLAPSSLTQSEIRTLLDTRAAQGFTAVQMSVLAFLHMDDAKNAYGDNPFVNGTDLSRPLEVGRRTTDPNSSDYDYWDHVDWIVSQAEDRDLAITLVPSWYGYAGEDWRSNVSTSNAATYGTFLGKRLGHHLNLLWMLGGDNDPTSSDTAKVPSGADRSDKTAATNAMGNAIRSGEPVRHLMTYHAKRPVSSLKHFAGQPWHTFASAYADEYTYKHAAASSGQGLPVVVTEAYYDARTKTPVLDHRRLRAQAWWSVLSGAGFAYGHENVWDLDPAWKTGIRDASATDVTRILTILAELGQVKASGSVLTSGAGDSTGLDRAITGRAGNTAVTYLPSGRTVTVDLGALGGDKVTLTWIDPATGRRNVVGTLGAAGTKQLSWPGWPDAVLDMTKR